MSSAPAPGWYPDPEIPGHIRYWDGAAWVAGTSRPAEGAGGHDGGSAAAEEASAQPAPEALEQGGRVIQGEVLSAQTVRDDQGPFDMSSTGMYGPLITEPVPPPADTAPPGDAGGPPPAAFRPPATDLFGTTERRPAGLGRRLLARIADLLVPLAAATAVAIPLVPDAVRHVQDRIDRVRYEGRDATVWLLDGTTGTALAAVLGTLLVAMLLYEAIPTWRWGRTLGKTLFGLRVVDIDSHEPPTLGQSVRRWFVFGLPGVLAVGVVGVVWGAFDKPWRQTWHDKAARTFVARD